MRGGSGATAGSAVGIRRGKEDGYSRKEIMDAVCLEAMKRADLAVIAAAGLDAERVTLLRWQDCVRRK